MIVSFTYYLHDDKESWYEELRDALPQDIADDEADALLERAQRPFHEVTLECELDTETGKVTVVKSSL